VAWGTDLGSGLESGLGRDLGRGLESGLGRDLGSGWGSGLESGLGTGLGSGTGDKTRVSKLQYKSGYVVSMKLTHRMFSLSHKIRNIQTQLILTVEMTYSIGRKSPQHDRSHASEQSCRAFCPNLKGRGGKGEREERTSSRSRRERKTAH